MRTNFIIDFEFNGLPAYKFKPEIVQVKIMNLETKDFLVTNFLSKKGITAGAKICMGLSPDDKTLPFAVSRFTKEKFFDLVRAVGGTPEDNFWGFSTRTDKSVLSSYGVVLEHYFDLQSSLRLTKYEKRLAFEGCSLEAACFITGAFDVNEIDHSSNSELEAIASLYDVNSKLRHKKGLTVMPWGEFSGTPIKEYCRANRRRADGYRYNNSDDLASALTFYCSEIDEEERAYWEQFPDFI